MIDEQKGHPCEQSTGNVVSSSTQMGNTNIIPYEQYANNVNGTIVSKDVPSEVENIDGLHACDLYACNDTLTSRINNLK